MYARFVFLLLLTACQWGQFVRRELLIRGRKRSLFRLIAQYIHYCYLCRGGRGLHIFGIWTQSHRLCFQAPFHGEQGRKINLIIVEPAWFSLSMVISFMAVQLIRKKNYWVTTVLRLIKNFPFPAPAQRLACSETASCIYKTSLKSGSFSINCYFLLENCRQLSSPWRQLEPLWFVEFEKLSSLTVVRLKPRYSKRYSRKNL